MIIPDPIELWESGVEHWADTHVQGDSFICDCGERCKLENGVILTPNPYGSPVCPDCAMADPAYAAWVRT
jgi:hypothetical protein